MAQVDGLCRLLMMVIKCSFAHWGFLVDGSEFPIFSHIIVNSLSILVLHFYHKGCSDFKRDLAKLQPH